MLDQLFLVICSHLVKILDVSEALRQKYGQMQGTEVRALSYIKETKADDDLLKSMILINTLIKMFPYKRNKTETELHTPKTQWHCQWDSWQMNWKYLERWIKRRKRVETDSWQLRALEGALEEIYWGRKLQRRPVKKQTAPQKSTLHAANLHTMHAGWQGLSPRWVEVLFLR